MEIEEIRAFRRDLRAFSRILSRQVQACCYEVTPAQCHVLLELADSGPVPNGYLAALLQVDASTLTRTVDQLVAKGLIIREPHPTDRRATLLEPSSRGSKVVASIHESADALYRGILEEIPPSRRKDVLRRFAQLVELFRSWQERENGDCSAP
jgi:DNA-binding MarR family transcriptional regulator